MRTAERAEATGGVKGSHLALEKSESATGESLVLVSNSARETHTIARVSLRNEHTIYSHPLQRVSSSDQALGVAKNALEVGCAPARGMGASNPFTTGVPQRLAVRTVEHCTRADLRAQEREWSGEIRNTICRQFTAYGIFVNNGMRPHIAQSVVPE